MRPRNIDNLDGLRDVAPSHQQIRMIQLLRRLLPVTEEGDFPGIWGHSVARPGSQRGLQVVEVTALSGKRLTPEFPRQVREASMPNAGYFSGDILKRTFRRLRKGVAE